MSAAERWLGDTWEIVIDDEATIYVIETQEAAEAIEEIHAQMMRDLREGAIESGSVRRI